MVIQFKDIEGSEGLQLNMLHFKHMYPGVNGMVVKLQTFEQGVIHVPRGGPRAPPFCTAATARAPRRRAEGFFRHAGTFLP